MMGSGDSPAADPEQVLALQVMAPFHLGVEKAILGHRYGKAAKLLFSYLQALTKMGRTQAGWVPVPQRVADALGLSRQSRIRGLRALEHLGLVELEQSGRRAYRARLCYRAPATRGTLVRPRSPRERAAMRRLIAGMEDATEAVLGRSGPAPTGAGPHDPRAAEERACKGQPGSS